MKLEKSIDHNRKTRGGEREMCQKIRELHGMTHMDLLRKTNQLGAFPIDVAQICYEMGIRLMPFDFAPIEAKMQETGDSKGASMGAIVAKGNDLAILYQKGDTVHGRRFTVAHEIAHSCLHMDPTEKIHMEFRMACEQESPKEREANAFARGLLIPSETLRMITNGATRVDAREVPMLAEKFMVSESTMRARLGELEIEVTDTSADSGLESKLLFTDFGGAYSASGARAASGSKPNFGAF